MKRNVTGLSCLLALNLQVKKRKKKKKALIKHNLQDVDLEECRSEMIVECRSSLMGLRADKLVVRLKMF